MLCLKSSDLEIGAEIIETGMDAFRERHPPATMLVSVFMINLTPGLLKNSPQLELKL